MEFVFPTTTPVQFDPDAAHASLNRIMHFKPEYAFLTHYSRIGNLTHHAECMHNLIDAHVEIARNADINSRTNNTDRFNAISTALESLLLQRLNTHGCQMPQKAIASLLSADIRLNTMGLEHWLKHSDQTVG